MTATDHLSLEARSKKFGAAEADGDSDDHERCVRPFFWHSRRWAAACARGGRVCPARTF